MAGETFSYEDAFKKSPASKAGETFSYEEAAKPTEASGEPTEPATTSAGGAFVHEAARSVLPGVAGIAGGAAAGFGAGLLAGPAAPIVAPIAAIGGGILGGLGVRKAQDAVADEVAPDSFMGTKAAAKEAEEHPWATFGGGLVGMGKPSVSALSGGAKAFGTAAGRQGIKTVLGAATKKGGLKALQETAQTAGAEGEAAKQALEHFGHGLGAAAGVGTQAGMGIAEGEDPLTATAKGVAGLAVKPYVGPGGMFFDPLKPKGEVKGGTQSVTETETPSSNGLGIDTTLNQEELDALNKAQGKVAPAPEPAPAPTDSVAPEPAPVPAAADPAVKASTDKAVASATAAGLDQTAAALQEAANTPVTRKNKNKKATTPKPQANESQIPQEPAAENVAAQAPADSQPVAPEQNAAAGADVLLPQVPVEDEEVTVRQPDTTRFRENRPFFRSKLPELEVLAADATRTGDVAKLQTILNEAQLRVGPQFKNSDRARLLANTVLAQLERMNNPEVAVAEPPKAVAPKIEEEAPAIEEPDYIPEDAFEDEEVPDEVTESVEEQPPLEPSADVQPIVAETPVAEPTVEQKPDYWYGTPESEKFFKQVDELLEQRASATTKGNRDKIDKNLKELRLEFQKNREEDPERYPLRVDKNKMDSIVFDQDGVKQDELLSLKGAKWIGGEADIRITDTALSSRRLRPVMTADDRMGYVDMNSLPEVIREEIDANTPEAEKNLSELARRLKDEGLKGASRTTLNKWAKEGMPTEDIEAAISWVRNRTKEKSQVTENKAAENDALSIDQQIGDGSATIGSTFIGSKAAEGENDAAVGSLIEKILTRSTDTEVPAEDRLAALNSLLSRENEYELTDAQYTVLAKRAEELTNELGDYDMEVLGKAADIATEYNPEEIIEGLHRNDSEDLRAQRVKKGIDSKDKIEYNSRLDEFPENQKERKIGFLYLKGGTNQASPLRGEEGLRLLSESTKSDSGRGEGAGQTNRSFGDSFRLLAETVKKAGLEIAPAFFRRYANPRTEFGEAGAEHSVYLDPHTGRVIKVTHPDLIGDGALGAKGSAHDYFTSLMLNNAMFGTETRFEGLVNTGEGELPQVITSQPHFKGRAATTKEIAAELKRRGFTKVEARKDANIWEHKDLGVGIYDAVPANVIRTEDGRLHFFDVDVFPKIPLEEVMARLKEVRDMEDLNAQNTGPQGVEAEAIRQTVGKTIRTYSGDQFLFKTANNSTTKPWQRKLLNLLIQAHGGTGSLDQLKVNLVDKFHGDMGGSPAFYRPWSHEIYVSQEALGKDGQVATDTGLHEVMHALVHPFFRESNETFLTPAQREARDSIVELYNEARRKALDSGLTTEDNIRKAADSSIEKSEDETHHYGWTSIQEFVSEAMSNKAFQDVLRKIEMDNPVTKTRTNAWEFLKDQFRAILGLPKKDNSALSHAIDHILDLATEKTPIRAAKNGGRAFVGAGVAGESTALAGEENLRKQNIGAASEKEELDKLHADLESQYSILEDSDEGYIRNHQAYRQARSMVNKKADESGYTLPVYHGSAAKNGVIRIPKGNLGVAAHVSENRDFARVFAKGFGSEDEQNHLHEWRINPDEMFDPENPEHIERLSELIRKKNVSREDIRSAFKSYSDAGLTIPREVLDKRLALFKDASSWKKQAFMWFENPLVQNTLKEAGFRGYKDRESTGEPWTDDDGKSNYAVFNPEDIKSADPFTYDEAGNLIPLSQRFNPENPDIMYGQRTAREKVSTSQINDDRAANEKIEYQEWTADDADYSANKMYQNATDKNSLYQSLFSTMDSTDPVVKLHLANKFRNVIGDLISQTKAKIDAGTKLSPEEFLAYKDAQDRKEAIEDLMVDLSSKSAQVTRHSALLRDSFENMNTQAYIKTFLGKTPADAAREKGFNLRGFYQGLREIKQKVAAVTMKAADTFLEDAGITEAKAKANLEAILAHPDTTFADVENTIGALLPESNAAKTRSLAEQIYKLHANAANDIAGTDLAKVIANALANKQLRGTGDEFIKKLNKFIKIGDYDVDAINDTVLKTLGVNGYDAAFIKQIRKSIDGLPSLPEGEIRNRASLEILQKVRKRFYSEVLKDWSNPENRKHVWDLVTSAWQAGVLSGPPTMGVNLMGSAASVLGETVMDAVGHAAKTRDVRYFADILRGFTSALLGTKGGLSSSAMNEFRSSMRGEGTKYRNSMMEEAPHLENLDPEMLKGAMKALAVHGNRLKWVGRFMTALDAVNMTAADEAQQRMAIRYFLSEKKGFSPEEVKAMMKNAFDPDETVVSSLRDRAQTEVAAAMPDKSAKEQERWVKRRVSELMSLEREKILKGVTTQSREAAEHYTYNDQATGLIGKYVVGLTSAINKSTPGAKFIFSFMNTLANIMNQTLDFTPYGFLRATNKTLSQRTFKRTDRFAPKLFEEGSPQQYAEHARAAFGTAMLLSIAYMAYRGYADEQEGKDPYFTVTGAGPKDAADREQLVETRGWQPNSIKIGDMWYRYTDVPVLGIPLGAVGTLFDTLRYKKDEQTNTELAQAMAISAITTVFDKNLLQGANNLFNTLQGSSTQSQVNALGRLTGGAIGGFTNPGLTRWARNTFAVGNDGLVNRQDQSGLTGWVYSLVPFSMGYNTPALNTLGEPIKQPWYTATTRRLNDFSNIPPHPIITPLVQAGLMLPNPSKTTEFKYIDPQTTEVKKTKTGKHPEVMRRYVELRGQMMKEMLTPDMIQGLQEMAKEDKNAAQQYLDSKIGGRAREYAVKMIESELMDGKLNLG